MLRVWGPYINFGGAYTWRGLFSEFYGIFGACDDLACVHHTSSA